ncbi:pitrilysin family protein [Coprobacillaceae bacterium CR2/5/TPMF4]|nr:pitrilysin family protein [Coprobacillaceae bacterium CR2/5/TPMF4]
MYDDDPDWQVYFGSIQNLYQQHPVAVDIAGTVETVNRTDKDMLELCYNTFYHPSNMMIFVVGNIDPDKAMATIKENQDKKNFSLANPIVLKKVNEPKKIKTKEKVLTMDVEMNKIIVSIKVNEILENPKDKIKRELALNLLFDLLFSKSAKLYNDWLNQGIINDSFSASFTQERDYAFIQIGCDCNDYETLKEKLLDLIKDFDTIKIDQEDFNRIKKKNIGLFINMFNSPESIANLFSRYYFEGTNAFDLVDEVAKLEIDDIYDVFKYFDLQYTSVCIVKKIIKVNVKSKIVDTRSAYVIITVVRE